MEFYFKLNEEKSIYLLFAQQHRVIQFDMNTAEIEVLYDLKGPLMTQPNFFSINDDQTCTIISNTKDSIFINLKKQLEYDIDDLYRISDMKKIHYDIDD